MLFINIYYSCAFLIRLLTNSSILVQQFNIWLKFWFLIKKVNFWVIISVFIKISIVDQKINFWHKFRFLVNFGHIFDFRPEVQFMTQISVFDQNSIFVHNFEFVSIYQKLAKLTKMPFAIDSISTFYFF